MGTWNVQAFFMHEFTRGPRPARKVAEVQRLARDTDILLLQELHGEDGDEATLRQLLPAHIVLASFGASAGVGGVAVAVARHVVQGMEVAMEHEVVPGRVLAVTFVGGGRSLTVVSLHVDPRAAQSEKQHVIRLIREAVPRPGDGGVIIGGDFNWVAPGEHRTELPSMTPRAAREPEAHVWDVTFPDLVELYQPCDTRVRLVDGRPTLLARLDRLYVNMPRLDVWDSRPAVRTAHNVMHVTRLSDHAPVLATLHCPQLSPPRSPTTPRWVVNSAEFPQAVTELVSEVRWPSDPFEALAVLKEVLLGACMLARRRLRAIPHEASLVERLWWATKCWRCARAGDKTGTEDALAAAPHLADVLGPGGTAAPDLEALSEHIQSMQLELADAETAEAHRGNSENAQRRADLALARKAHWARTGARASLAAVRAGDALGSTPLAVTASRLRDHWAPTFAESPMCPVAARRLAPFVRPIPDGISWHATVQDMQAVMERARDSAPGPDGIRYCAYAVVSDVAAPILHRVYEALLMGAAPPRVGTIAFWRSCRKGGR